MKVVIDAEKLTLDDLELMDLLASGKINGKAKEVKAFFGRFAVKEDGTPMDPGEAEAEIGKVPLAQLKDYLGQAGEGLGVLDVPLESAKP